MKTPSAAASQAASVVASIMVMSSASWGASDDPPRYRLSPGEQLTYHGHEEFKYQTGSFITEESMRIWVLSQNAAGGWKVLAECEGSERRIDSRPEMNQPAREEVAWIRADIGSDGRQENIESTLTHPIALPQIIPLPRDTQEMKLGWSVVNGEDHSQERYSIIHGTSRPGQAMIHVVHETDVDKIYLFTDARDVTFDLNRGVPVKEDQTGSQGYGFIGKRSRHTELNDIATADAATLNQMDHAFTVYRAVQTELQAAFAAQNMSPEQLDAAQAKEMAALTKARSEIDLPEFQRLIDQDITELPSMVSYEKESAKRREALFDSPAADWNTTDLDGKTHGLSDYKGKVVILDFWYRGCGPCMMAMPQMEQVAQHYAGQPVVLLGMTIDRKPEDAEFVVKKMGLTYITLNAKKIAESYKINAFPTMLILDQVGVIKDIHAGYSPTLREDIEKRIDALLANLSPAPSAKAGTTSTSAH